VRIKIDLEKRFPLSKIICIFHFLFLLYLFYYYCTLNFAEDGIMEVNNLERFKESAKEKLCLGMVITLSDPAVSELAGDAGWDFTWIDMEHAPLTIETTLMHVMALRGTGTAPFIRVPGNNPIIIKPLLELAPAGVIIPMVNTAAEAASAVAACRYPPNGIRGCGPRRGLRYGAIPFNDYLKSSESDPMVIIQIEHIDAVKNLDEILKVDGVDSICVGPCDLSASMGKLDSLGAPEVEEVIDEICEKAHAAGKIIGSAVGSDPDTIEKWKTNRHASWLAVTGDAGCIFAKSREIINNNANTEAKKSIY
jgi:2-dehydro-3-deoxyglucarate aldolase/4-hydroxy-2-oxoheptanedioate aldolase